MKQPEKLKLGFVTGLLSIIISFLMIIPATKIMKRSFDVLEHGGSNEESFTVMKDIAYIATLGNILLVGGLILLITCRKAFKKTN